MNGPNTAARPFPIAKNANGENGCESAIVHEREPAGVACDDSCDVLSISAAADGKIELKPPLCIIHET
jgi:hypothetical protein